MNEISDVFEISLPTVESFKLKLGVCVDVAAVLLADIRHKGYYHAIQSVLDQLVEIANYVNFQEVLPLKKYSHCVTKLVAAIDYFNQYLRNPDHTGYRDFPDVLTVLDDCE
jgi:hypothetical protein